MKLSNLRFIILLMIEMLFVNFNKSNANTQLFSIIRSKDANQIIYTLNLENDNKLNQQEPIKIIWLKKTENNKIEPLTWIQRKFSYGVVYLKKNESYAKFHFAGYSGRVFELKKDNNGKYKVCTFYAGKVVIVKQIYIYIIGGTFWVPEIPKVELYGVLTENGKLIIETIKA